MKAIALFAIKAYQRYISPRKGFCCAYRVHTGYRSCSVLGYRAIRRYGVASGIAVLQKRFKRCSAAHQQHQISNHSPRLRHRNQSGFCDVPCDCPSIDIPSCDCPSFDMPCDTPSGHAVSNFCESLQGCNMPSQSCDCGSWQRAPKNSEETPPYVPPPRNI